MGPFPSHRGKRFVITFIDCFSRFTILVPSADHTGTTVARVLMDRVVSVFGLPRRILSDRGREFTGIVWSQLQLLLGCSMVRTSPYHPQGIGIVERSHRTVGDILRAVKVDDPRSAWPDVVSSAQLSLNTSPGEPHGFSPFEVIFGRVAPLPADRHIPAYGTDPAAAPWANTFPRSVTDFRRHSALCSVHPTSKPSRHRTLFILGCAFW
ncbi:Retrovirus-related Pol polyprotein [Chionoecetes opilio]|uniref:Retrovirus-related Pol polyprotein n=1 Tax=Chionoecetes opilio TaxID=41210 RepID=A0A8J5CFN8_CHIOP|nr:Retrovirus-related Pol polyprotein [Chionoecetes opilio]